MQPNADADANTDADADANANANANKNKTRAVGKKIRHWPAFCIFGYRHNLLKFWT
jgi:hypothetical protein